MNKLLKITLCLFFSSLTVALSKISDDENKPSNIFFTNNIRLSKSYVVEVTKATVVLAQNSTGDGKNFSNDTATVFQTFTRIQILSTTTKKAALVPLAVGEAEEEKHYSLTIFFILLIVAIGIGIVHLLLQTKFHYLPESVAIVLIGSLLGLVMKLLETYNVADWKTEESFPPTMFFLILLPPIIFESGYNLHKGNFFQNIGTILLFAIFGTVLSALIVGGGIYILGMADVVYRLSPTESFCFGSLISAVDPVATLAIFHAIDVDPVLYMLVFGESVLNDAVSIVLATTFMESGVSSVVQIAGVPPVADLSTGYMFLCSVGRFCLVFFASAGIGVIFGLISALTLKFVDLRRTPSLEFGMMLVFSYAPYGFAEGIHLSGIMAILFCGIVMSHYTHLNLSPVVQITTQLTFRTIAFIAETCVFAYLGLAIFSFPHLIKPAFVIWSLILILIGRAVNIYPLSYLANHFREHKITPKMQFIMWFSGLRGAVSFALSLHLDMEAEKRNVVVSTTLIIVLFTILFLGGSTMPLMKFLDSNKGVRGPVKGKRRKKRRIRGDGEVTLSKTKEMGETIDSADYLSSAADQQSEDEENFAPLAGAAEIPSSSLDVGKFGSAAVARAAEFSQSNYYPDLRGFMRLDVRYLRPFFTRSFTRQEVKEGERQVNNLVKQWCDELRADQTEEPLVELQRGDLLNRKNPPTENDSAMIESEMGEPPFPRISPKLGRKSPKLGQKKMLPANRKQSQKSINNSGGQSPPFKRLQERGEELLLEYDWSDESESESKQLLVESNSQSYNGFGKKGAFPDRNEEDEEEDGEELLFLNNNNNNEAILLASGCLAKNSIADGGRMGKYRKD